jgi:hypothetical protein
VGGLAAKVRRTPLRCDSGWLRGVLVEVIGQTDLAEPDGHGDEARTLRPLQPGTVG